MGNGEKVRAPLAAGSWACRIRGAGVAALAALLALSMMPLSVRAIASEEDASAKEVGETADGQVPMDPPVTCDDAAFIVEGQDCPDLQSALDKAVSVLAGSPDSEVTISQLRDFVAEATATVTVPAGKAVLLDGLQDDGSTASIRIGGTKDFSMVRVQGAGALELANVTLTGSADEGVAAPEGQLVDVESGSTLRLSEGTLLEKGFAVSGGGVCLGDETGGASAALEMASNARIEACRAEQRGGGVLGRDCSMLRMTDEACLSKNIAGAEGGGAAFEAGAGPVVVDMSGSSSVEENRAYGRGGGVYVAPGSADSNVYLSDSACITNNFCEGGEGVLGAGLYGGDAAIYLQGSLYLWGNDGSYGVADAGLFASNLGVSGRDPLAVRVTGSLTGSSIGIDGVAEEGSVGAVAWSLEKGCAADAAVAGSCEDVVSDSDVDLHLVSDLDSAQTGLLLWGRDSLSGEGTAVRPRQEGDPAVPDADTVFTVEHEGKILEQIKLNADGNLLQKAANAASDFLKSTSSATEVTIKQWKSYEAPRSVNDTYWKISVVFAGIPEGKTIVVDGQRDVVKGSGFLTMQALDYRMIRLQGSAGGTLKLTNITLQGTRDANVYAPTAYGGLVHVDGGMTLILSDGAVLEKAWTSHGGAVFVVGNQLHPAKLVMEGNACIRDCQAAEEGGAVCIEEYGTLLMKDRSSLVRNKCSGKDNGKDTGKGGAIACGRERYGGHTTVEMRDYAFGDENEARRQGGFVYVCGYLSQFIATDNAEVRNTQSGAAAIYQEGGDKAKTTIDLSGNFKATGNYAYMGYGSVLRTSPNLDTGTAKINGNGDQGVRFSNNACESGVVYPVETTEFPSAVYIDNTPLCLEGKVSICDNWVGGRGATSGTRGNIYSQHEVGIAVSGPLLEGGIGVQCPSRSKPGNVFAKVQQDVSLCAAEVTGLESFFNDSPGYEYLVGMSETGEVSSPALEKDKMIKWGGESQVRFDANGGAFEDGSLFKSLQMEVVVPRPYPASWRVPAAIDSVPVRDGYDFDGWYFKKEDSAWGESYADKVGMVVSEVGGSNWCVYARWKQKGVEFSKVGFDSASGTYRLLSGASFNVYKWQGEAGEITASSINDAAGTVPLAGKAGNYSARWIPLTSDKDGKTVDGVQPTDVPKTFSSADDGTVQLDGLDPSAWYMLVETGAPDGYQVPGGQWAFKVSFPSDQAEDYDFDVNQILGKRDASGFSPPDFRSSVDVASGKIEGACCVNVPSASYALPHTGASGAAPWFSVGIGLVAMSFFAAVARRCAAGRRLHRAWGRCARSREA